MRFPFVTGGTALSNCIISDRKRHRTSFVWGRGGVFGRERKLIAVAGYVKLTYYSNVYKSSVTVNAYFYQLREHHRGLTSVLHPKLERLLKNCLMHINGLNYNCYTRLKNYEFPIILISPKRIFSFLNNNVCCTVQKMKRKCCIEICILEYKRIIILIIFL